MQKNWDCSTHSLPTALSTANIDLPGLRNQEGDRDEARGHNTSKLDKQRAVEATSVPAQEVCVQLEQPTRPCLHTLTAAQHSVGVVAQRYLLA
jgi:hypothetical protein